MDGCGSHLLPNGLQATELRCEPVEPPYTDVGANALEVHQHWMLSNGKDSGASDFNTN